MSTYTLTRSYRHSLAVRRRRAATARRLRTLRRSLQRMARTLRRPLVARLILSAVISSLATAVVVLSVVAFR